ncbi:MAG: F0F1 ATP synthase subunit A [Deltaproteobacteria bacterium]|nr:F0F1 ATP synthase subunit A [Deltaproteobacteria bacterium]
MEGAEAQGFELYGVEISPEVTTTWGIMAFLVVVGFIAGRLRSNFPGRFQTVTEGAVLAFYESVEAVLPGRGREIMPLVATAWLFIGAANLLGLIPGLHSPTAHLSVTAALAVIVFVSVHYLGIKHSGLRAYLKHYLSPSPILLPFHIVSEISRTLALAVRLFGNMMSLEMAALMVFLVAPLLVDVPVLFLHIIEALVQAYIFGVLTLIYIAGAIQAHDLKKTSQPSPQKE